MSVIRINFTGETDFINFDFTTQELAEFRKQVSGPLKNGAFIASINCIGDKLNNPKDNRPLNEILGVEGTDALGRQIADYYVQTESYNRDVATGLVFQAMKSDHLYLNFTCFRSPNYVGDKPVYIVRNAGMCPLEDFGPEFYARSALVWGSMVRAHNEKYWKHSTANLWLALSGVK